VRGLARALDTEGKGSFGIALGFRWPAGLRSKAVASDRTPRLLALDWIPQNSNPFNLDFDMVAVF